MNNLGTARKEMKAIDTERNNHSVSKTEIIPASDRYYKLGKEVLIYSEQEKVFKCPEKHFTVQNEWSR